MPSRTLFLHITPAGKTVFYLLATLSALLCLYGIYRRWKTWQQGRPGSPIADWSRRLRTAMEHILAHRRVRRRRFAGTLHALIFAGILVLFIGTCIVAIEHYGAWVFGEKWLYKGTFYLTVKLALDLFGTALLVGTVLALARRFLRRPDSLGHTWKDGAFLTLLLTATLTGFLLEGAGIAIDPQRRSYAPFSPVGSLFALPLYNALSVERYVFLWWLHAVLVLALIAAVPYGRWLHLFTIPPTIALQPARPMGALEPVPVEQVEQTGRIGLATLADFTRWELMSLDACMECGRCTEACPAHQVGKPLDPKQVVLDLRQLLDAAPQSAPGTDVISDDALWACTNCHACVRECPALIRHVDIIDGIRRYRVAEGRLTGTAATVLRQLGSRENPWGLPAAQRMEWARGLEVPIATPDDGREVLLWVGCAGAFEPRAQQSLRALVQLLQRAGVHFRVAGPAERCTGDPARRIGDEFLFQQLAQANIDLLHRLNAQNIITQCPHCFHTLKNEYPQFGGHYHVLHHTQYLRQLLQQGRLTRTGTTPESVTYHDPCFLARVNREVDAPRTLLYTALEEPLREVQPHGSRTLCCGAGGGRMWMEEDRSQRPGVHRATGLLATGARTIAVGCPFCKVMIGDSVAQVAGENAPTVQDVAEILLAACTSATPLSEHGTA
ncbi:MAG: (Fe-S)-binding protein [Chloroherpetonaceae bacterium]|nr:heterodisulfide reductase-related iron-sulfur binding cluster [Chthonomonadaceae bacterium]MDW8208621.1 (Fe-S)-binding protein [Chloroherpetonaceae bacterium]